MVEALMKGDYLRPRGARETIEDFESDCQQQEESALNSLQASRKRWAEELSDRMREAISDAHRDKISRTFAAARMEWKDKYTPLDLEEVCKRLTREVIAAEKAADAKCRKHWRLRNSFRLNSGSSASKQLRLQWRLQKPHASRRLRLQRQPGQPLDLQRQ